MNFSINLKTILIAALLSGLNAGAIAQHDHNSHAGPEPMEMPLHGGMIRTAGRYQIEMVVDMLQLEDKVLVYLINSKGKIMSNEAITGHVIFMYGDNTTNKSSLAPRGDDHFAARLDRTDRFTAMVTFRVKGKEVVAGFEHSGLDTGGKGKAFYTCSMHPGVQEEESGSCPICGMYLVKK